MTMERTPATHSKATGSVTQITATTIEYITCLAWHPRYCWYCIDKGEHWIDLGFEQRLPGFTDYRLLQHEQVLCIRSLVESYRQPDLYYPVTCTCGVPDDAGFNRPARVLHKGSQIIWEADVEHWRDALHSDFANGPLHPIQTVRWVFEREQYRQDINRLQLDMRAHIERINPETFKTFWLSDKYYQNEPLPDLQNVQVCDLEPGPYVDDFMDWPVPVLSY
jgi:hypothetical protein